MRGSLVSCCCEVFNSTDTKRWAIAGYIATQSNARGRSFTLTSQLKENFGTHHGSSPEVRK